MAYKKWVSNADPQDWVTELVDEDGNSYAKMGVPAEYSAEQIEELEANGRVLADSSAKEAKEYSEGGAPVQVGRDIAGSAPVFENAGPSNQKAAAEKSGSTDQDDK